ncbi:hypothetical protein [Leptospira biflexa]|uniref:hypothetical protein n=1 Tax=Leptospira biflexa TaxID=172 RepID=UPI0014385020|nr:hypothetical protein [Leptospira biflexa]
MIFLLKAEYNEPFLIQKKSESKLKKAPKQHLTYNILLIQINSLARMILVLMETHT